MKLSEIRGKLQRLSGEFPPDNLPPEAKEILSGLGILYNGESSPVQRIDSILSQTDTNNYGTSSDTLPYNSYPFGVKTRNTYPRLVAICRGKHKLGTFLEIMLAKSKKMEMNHHDEEKLVIILTDKWDSDVFGMYEKNFLRYAFRYRIHYIFLLFTEYGITNIPFLPKDFAANGSTYFDDFEDDEAIEEVIRISNGEPIEFTIISLEYAPRKYRIQNYKFDLNNMIWEKTDEQGTVGGNIPSQHLPQFIENILWITEKKENFITPKSRMLEDTVCRLKVAGKVVEWNREYEFNGRDTLFNELDETIFEFIQYCEWNKIVCPVK